MKKLLLASTALVMSAGVASAQVALSGDARMGVTYDNSRDSKLQFSSRARVTFTMSGETDTGLAFGASFRADNAAGAAGNERMTGGNVFISGEFGRLRFGDVAGAARSVVGDLYAVGYTDAGALNELRYLDRNAVEGVNTLDAALTNDSLYTYNRRTAVLYDYSIEGFTFALGLAQPNRQNFTTSTAAGSEGATGVLNSFLYAAALDGLDGGFDDLIGGELGRYDERQFSLGVSYSFDGFTAALGYEDVRGKIQNLSEGTSNSFSAKHTIASLEYDMDQFKVKGFVGRMGGNLGTALGEPDNGARRTHYGLSVQGNFDATTVTAFAVRGFLTTDYGIGAGYDLGGGAALKGGLSRQGSNSTLGINSVSRADLGLTFSF